MIDAWPQSVRKREVLPNGAQSNRHGERMFEEIEFGIRILDVHIKNLLKQDGRNAIAAQKKDGSKPDGTNTKVKIIRSV